MDTQSYKTVSLKAGDIKKEWVVIDATDLVVGRLAARVALVLRGKNKASFTPHMDCGGVKNDQIVYVPFNKAIRIDKPIDRELINVLNVLSI